MFYVYLFIQTFPLIVLTFSLRLLRFYIKHVYFFLGENVKEFFFRVASLAFEMNVLAELEKSGSRQIGDVVSKYLKRCPVCAASIS